jgi:thymidylate synthase
MNEIKTNPNSRRLIVSGWNPEQASQVDLPPCHTLWHLKVENEKILHCQLYQRSADAFLGVPFNISSYALLTQMIANVCDLQVGDFIHTFGDLHIYSNHLEQVEKLCAREPLPLPQLIIKRKPDSIFDYKYEDFELKDYRHHPPISAPVAV